MSEKRLHHDLHPLIDALLNDSITPQEHSQLEALLLSNPDAQEEYLRYIDLHLALTRISAVSDEPLSFAKKVRFDQRSPAKPVNAAHPSNFRGTAALVVAGLLICIGVFSAIGFQGTSSEHSSASALVVQEQPTQNVPTVPVERPAARLAQAANAELVREFVPEIDSPLRTDHEYALVKGMLELAFSSGATAIIQSPAVFVVRSGECMELKFGNCSVHAPDGAEGFQVFTPQNSIVDLGTRFSVEVGDNGCSEVQVVEGAAEVYSNQRSGPASLLRAGEAVRSSQDATGITAARFDANQFQRSLPDRIISYEANEVTPGKGVRDLVSLKVQRGGEVRTYAAEELIGIQVTHFLAHSNVNNCASDQELPADVTDLLAKDRALNTGLINFDRPLNTPFPSAEEAGDNTHRPGLGVRFDQPVRNGPGPDVVLFEVQSVAYPLEGDHFRVSPLHYKKGLRSHVVTNYDITMNSANARKVANFEVYAFPKPVQSAADFQVQPVRHGKMTLPFYALAVGIDLSDLGYTDNAAVDGLFFEDANHNKSIVIDPVFIAALPPLSAKISAESGRQIMSDFAR